MKKVTKLKKVQKPRFRKTGVVGSVCCYCSRPFAYPIYKTIEHIVPTSKGGTDRIDNLKNACNECNSWRSNDNLENWYLKVKLMLINNKTLNFRTYTRIDLQNILENLNINFTGLGDLYKTHNLIMDNVQESQTPTLGEQRVRTTFNPSNESVVDRIKQKSAELIDLLQAVRNDEVSKTYDKTPQELQAQSGEKLRLISLAQTGYEEAAMWAVKAATYTLPFFR